ncbi:hypothetical protein [Amycolatopsis sp. NPDC059021]|uniref:hypothetical protein n=1 Tax=Amycolatopsis sp. NPDC059021 TaxID=3346704 RepID=UPI00366B7DFC
MSDFELIFAVDDLSDDVIDQVYDRYDSIVAGHETVTLLTVTAEGATALTAAKAAIRDLENIDGVVIHRCYEDLVSRRDIADRAEVSPQAVGQWIRGDRQRAHPFPDPFNLVSGGIWLWGEVNAWLRRSGLNYYDLSYPCREDYADINRWINYHRAQSVAVTVDFVFNAERSLRHEIVTESTESHPRSRSFLVHRTYAGFSVDEGEVIAD